jgi:uncharacterized protein YbjT (DUF2867 family)
MGHDAVPAATSTGVDAVTGTGVMEVIRGADVVIDASDAPSHEDAVAREFFATSTMNLLAAEAAAGIRHHIVLSAVGVDLLAVGKGYYAAKLLQERLIAAGQVPYTIVRSTSFFEFLDTVAEFGAEGQKVRLPPALVRPIACADAAEAIVIAATGDPVSGVVEISGPRTYRLDELVRIGFLARGDRRTVTGDPAAPFWGITIEERTLIPSRGAIRFETRFEEWLLGRISAG